MSRVKDEDLGYDDFLAFMREASQDTEAEVGIFEDKAEVATYATFNEFGTKAIPSRPFMRSTFDRSYPQVADETAESCAMEMRKGKAGVKAAMQRVGLNYASRLKKAIGEWDNPPNSPATVEKKGANNPLIDTGTMQNAIDSKVED
jgi:hypothetical protein